MLAITYGLHNIVKSYLWQPSFYTRLYRHPSTSFSWASTDVGFFGLQEGFSIFHPVSFGHIPLAYSTDNRR